MRIRNFRQADIPILIDLQQLTAETDGLAVEDMIDFAAWSAYPELGEAYTVFIKVHAYFFSIICSIC